MNVTIANLSTQISARDFHAAVAAIQRQVTSTLAVQAAYVGQRTVKLISVRPLNLVNPATGNRQDPTLGQINFEENAARIALEGARPYPGNRFKSPLAERVIVRALSAAAGDMS